MKTFAYLFLGLCLTLAGCRQVDEREMTVNLPGVKTEADQDKVRAALAPLNGVRKESVAFDMNGHTMRVRYDSMQVAHKNIEIAIAEAGFDANEIKAIPQAAPAK